MRSLCRLSGLAGAGHVPPAARETPEDSGETLHLRAQRSCGVTEPRGRQDARGLGSAAMGSASCLIALCLLWRAAAASPADGLPEPQDVHFESVNLRNVVRWTAGDGAPDDSVYTVEYATYGVADEHDREQLKWTRVGRCSSIAQTECDASEETADLRDEYYARVRAARGHKQSAWSESRFRFNPGIDTVLGAPLVDVTVVHNYINISIKGPFRWRTGQVKKKSLWSIFPGMIYNVSVFNSGTQRTDFYLKSRNLTLGPVAFSSRFCVVVQAQSESLPLAHRPSAPLCVETPPDPFRDQLLTAMLGGVLPSALCLCVLAMLAGLVHCYVTDHRQKLPQSAHVVRMNEKLHTLQPEIPPTIIINLIKTGLSEDESAVLCPALPQPICDEEPESTVPPVSYAQQHASQRAGSRAGAADAHEDDSVSVDSEPWSQETDHSEDRDYAIVVSAAFQAEVGPYRTQGTAAGPQHTPEDEQDAEEEAQIFLDWSPEAGELKIPLMGLLAQEVQPAELLPNVILRQTSEDCSEQEDDFRKMERDWGLIIPD